MKIVCMKDVLLENLQIAAKAVSGKSTVPILECVLLQAEDNTFSLLGSDLEMAIETGAIAATIAEEGVVALDAKLLIEIVRRLPDGAISIESGKNCQTTIVAGKAQFKILGMPGEEYPTLPEVNKFDCITLPATILRNMVKQTIFAVSTDDSKPHMKGELLELRDDALHLVAVDGFRVAYAQLPIETAAMPFSVILPAKTMNEVSKILPNDADATVQIYMTSKHALFEIGETKVVSRLLSGEFIQYMHLFLEQHSTTVTLDRSALVLALERTTLIAMKELKKIPVVFQVVGNQLGLKSSTELGNVTDAVDADIDGNDLEIAFNPRFLIDALRVIEDDTIRLQFNSPLSPCLLCGQTQQESQFLVLPLRI